MAEGIYNTSSVASSRQIQLFLSLSRPRDRKPHSSPFAPLRRRERTPLPPSPVGMALTPKSLPTHVHPHLGYSRTPVLAAQPPTTTTNLRGCAHRRAPRRQQRHLAVVGSGSRIHQVPSAVARPAQSSADSPPPPPPAAVRTGARPRQANTT